MKRLWLIAAFVSALTVSLAQAPPHQAMTALPAPRQMYGAAVIGDYLYVLGGNVEPNNYTTSVHFARIHPDGSVGKWEATSPLLKPRAYINNTTLALNGTLYVVQGLNGDTDKKENTVLWARAQSNGDLSTWHESAPSPGSGVSCSAAVAAPGYIHLIGGSTGDREPTPLVWSASIGPDGTVLGWEPGPPLPVPLWFHCAGVVGDQVWVWSGLTGAAAETATRDMFMAPIEPSGKLGAWQTLPEQLPTGLYSASCAVSGNLLLSFCPRYKDVAASGDVWFAAVNPQSPLTWTPLQANVPVKMYFGLASDPRRGGVYLPGGRKGKESYALDPTVYYFRLASANPAPELSVQAAAPPQAVQAAQPAPAGTPGAAWGGAVEAGAGGQPAGTNAPGGRFPGFHSFEEAHERFRARAVPTVIYFYSDTNEQCQLQETILFESPMTAYADKVLFSAIDPFANPTVAGQYGIKSVPCWLFFDERGNLVDQKNRALRTPELAHSIKLIVP